MTEPDKARATRTEGSQRASAPGFRESLALLFTRRFGTYFVATLLSNIGTWAQQVAEPWLLLTLGASSFAVGLDGFALNGPVLALTLVGGVLADRADRRSVILLFQSIQMLCPALLILLMLLGVVRPWMVIALSFVVGITDALSMPSFQSILPSLVESRRLGAAFALNSTQFNLSRIAGPALAAALMLRVGALGCFTANTLSYVPFILVALWILPRRSPAASVAVREDRRIFEDFRELFRHPDIRGALLTVLTTATLCGPLVVFCPVLVKEVMHKGAGHLGGALAAFGVGGVVGAIALLALEGHIDRRVLGSLFALVYAMVVALVARSQSFLALVPLLAAAGAAMTMSNTSANSLLQTVANDRQRGQTASLFMLSMRGGLALGSVVTGAASARFGIGRALLVDGLLAVAFQIAIGASWLRARRTH